MVNEKGDLEGVKQKLEFLDREVESFLQLVEELKDMKGSVSSLQKRLLDQEGEITSRKHDLDELIESTNRIASEIEDRTRDVTGGLEQKAEHLFQDVKQGISEIGSICEQTRETLQEQQSAQLGELSAKYDELKDFCQILKDLVDSQEERVSGMKKSFTEASGIYGKIDSSMAEMKKSLFESQKRPYEIEHKLKNTEERLQSMVEESYSRQKSFIFILILIVIASVFFSIIALYLK